MDDQRPIAIAHAYGNSLARLARALASPADMVELDVWLERGRLVVRHERRLGPLPILYDSKPSHRPVDGLGRFAVALGRWYARLALRPLTLSEVAGRTKGDKELMLDLKVNGGSQRADFARTVVQFLSERGLTERTAVCGPDWQLLALIGQLAPRLRVFYTVNSAGLIEKLYQEWEPLDVKGISIHHPLLDEGLTRRLKDDGASIYTWTVDELARARQLQDWGADGIVSDDLALLSALKTS